MKRGLNINLDQLQFDVSNCDKALNDFCIKAIKQVISNPSEVIAKDFGFKAAKDTLFISTGNDDDYLGDYFDDIVRSIVFVKYCNDNYKPVLSQCRFTNYLDHSGSNLTVNSVLTISDQYIKRQLRNASLVFGDILEMLWSNDVQRQCINKLEEAYFDDLKEKSLVKLTAELKKLTFDASLKLNTFFENNDVLPTYATTYYVHELNKFIDQLPAHFKDIYYPKSGEILGISVPMAEIPNLKGHKAKVSYKNEETKETNDQKLPHSPSYKEDDWSKFINSAVRGVSLFFGTMSFLFSLKKMMNH